VLDGDGKPVNDALIEIWQANAQGKYAHPEDRQDKPLQSGFSGFGRLATDAEGSFRFTTIKPGRVPGPGGVLQAPHLLAAVFMRGLLKHLVTRVYFPDEPANDSDPVLKLVPAERRATLVASRRSDAQLEWNVVLQGERETAFFDC
jgi:protocatechuate 3,4-dioxygenase alpha subunit